MLTTRTIDASYTMLARVTASTIVAGITGITVLAFNAVLAVDAILAVCTISTIDIAVFVSHFATFTMAVKRGCPSYVWQEKEATLWAKPTALSHVLAQETILAGNRPG